MHIVTDETTRNTEALQDLARDLEPLFMDVMALKDETRAGLEITIPARYIASKYHVEPKSTLAFMFSSFCRGYIEGALYYKTRTEHPEQIENARGRMELVNILLEATDEELALLRDATAGKLGPEVDILIQTAQELRGKRGKA